ncbi:MAG TPA: hypothetical protein VHB79_05090 [Polyangiaceae bacterium]|nr:hypothetical protein [Polyangiaceae bacterium]
MKEPQRLLSGAGPAQELMTTGSVLRVPSGARQRALQFTGVAVGMSATSTAVAASASTLAKSLVLWVSLGAVGGGVASLTVSEVVSRLDAPHAAPPPAPAVPLKGGPVVGQPPAPTAEVPAAFAAAPALPAEAPAVADAPAVRAARGSKSRPEDAPATPPTASVGAFAETATHTSLLEEQRVIETARAAVARGDATSALATLDGYDRGYAKKQFGPEALALRVQALAAAGRLELARSLARDFEQRYPHHPLLARVQSVGH